MLSTERLREHACRPLAHGMHAARVGRNPGPCHGWRPPLGASGARRRSAGRAADPRRMTHDAVSMGLDAAAPKHQDQRGRRAARVWLVSPDGPAVMTATTMRQGAGAAPAAAAAGLNRLCSVPLKRPSATSAYGCGPCVASTRSARTCAARPRLRVRFRHPAPPARMNAPPSAQPCALRGQHALGAHLRCAAGLGLGSGCQALAGMKGRVSHALSEQHNAGAGTSRPCGQRMLMHRRGGALGESARRGRRPHPGASARGTAELRTRPRRRTRRGRRGRGAAAARAWMATSPAGRYVTATCSTLFARSGVGPPPSPPPLPCRPGCAHRRACGGRSCQTIHHAVFGDPVQQADSNPPTPFHSVSAAQARPLVDTM